MKHLHQQFSISFLRIALAVMSAITLAGVGSAQEGRTGKVQQGLVGGSVVSPEDQERYGLVTLNNGSCSGSLRTSNSNRKTRTLSCSRTDPCLIFIRNGTGRRATVRRQSIC